MVLLHVLQFVLWSISFSYVILPSPIKSANDNRTYLALRLSNELKVLLISDSVTDEAAAALAVSAGSWDEPKNVSGLAHFCEHMLFMGTAPYPAQGAFDDWIGSHSGKTNAYTSREITNYMFSVQWKFLNQTLDRFAPFFKSPLFRASSVDKEINAVNNEDKGTRQDDGWRLSRILSHLADPVSPVHSFTVGNTDTLNISGIRNMVENFFNLHYSSNKMTLIILGRESTSDLKNLALHHFGPITNKKFNKTIWTDMPYKGEYRGKLVRFKAVEQSNSLFLLWTLPPIAQSLSRRHHIDFLADIFKTSAPGSLKDELKTRGWVNDIGIVSYFSIPDIYIFYLSFDLTDQGMSNQKEVMKAAFQYLSLIKSQGLNLTLWKEMVEFSKLNFRFSEKVAPFDFVRSLADDFFSYSSQNVLKPPSMYKWNKTIANDLLAHLSPDNISLIIVRSHLPQGQLNLTEPIYGIQYSEEKISNSLLIELEWNGGQYTFRLPVDRATFVPTVFDLVHPQPDDKPDPTLVKINSNLRIWWKRDTHFATPKVDFKIMLRIPYIFGSPISPIDYAKSLLYVELVDNAMEKINYKTTPAGYSYSLKLLLSSGLQLSVSGYSEKLHFYLDVILNTMVGVANNPIDNITFYQQRQSLIDTYDNLKTNFAYTQAFMHWRSWIKKTLEPSSVRAALTKITIADLEKFTSLIFSKLIFAESLTHGNIISDEAINLTDLVLNKFRNSTLNGSIHIKDPHFILPCGSNYLYHTTHPNPNDLTSASLITYQIGLVIDQKLYARVSLLSEMMSSSCFDVLRSQWQLGYIAGCGMTTDTGTMYFYVVVQSSDYSSGHLDQRINVFLSNYQNKIKDMSTSDFLKYKDAVKANWKKKKLTLTEWTNSYWSQISSQFYHFERFAGRIAELDSISLKEIITFYDQNIISKLNQRRFTVGVDSNQLMVDIVSNGTKLSMEDKRTWQDDQSSFLEIFINPTSPWPKAKFNDSSICQRTNVRPTSQPTQISSSSFITGQPTSASSQISSSISVYGGNQFLVIFYLFCFVLLF